MKIKKGVNLNGIRPEVLIGVMVADSILPKFGQGCVITSCIDGKHKRSSAHATGRAVDLRTWTLRDKESAVRIMQDSLGDEFDVILESDHIHLEFDPKKGPNQS